MLRRFVIALGGACVLGGLVALAVTGGFGGWGALIFGGLLLLGTVCEQVRYKPIERQAPGPGWERTAERFFDEDSGKPVTVYIHPETGERRYVED